MALLMSSPVLFTRVSANKKTGPIPVSMSVKGTCPDACPLKAGGCYASGGPVNLHWLRLTKGLTGIPWKDFPKEVKCLPRGQLWRHNQAGDLPGEGDLIDAKALGELVNASKGKRGFTYTHKPTLPEQGPLNLIESNREAIAQANRTSGLVINLSANSLSHADALAKQGIGPVVTLLPSEQSRNCVTPEGRKVVVCPATQREFVTCQTCKLCANGSRSVIVGFPAHGVSTAKANAIANTPA